MTNNVGGSLSDAITASGVYQLVRTYARMSGFDIGVHTLRATAATSALDHESDIAKVQEWLGHASIATTKIYDRRKTRPEDSPTFAYSTPSRPRGAPPMKVDVARLVGTDDATQA